MRQRWVLLLVVVVLLVLLVLLVVDPGMWWAAAVATELMPATPQRSTSWSAPTATGLATRSCGSKATGVSQSGSRCSKCVASSLGDLCV
jgi:hypothetical protein